MRYCFELDRHVTHNLRYDECNVYWTVYDRKRGYKYPIGFFVELEDAERFVNLLNQQEHIQ